MSSRSCFGRHILTIHPAAHPLAARLYAQGAIPQSCRPKASLKASLGRAYVLIFTSEGASSARLVRCLPYCAEHIPWRAADQNSARALWQNKFAFLSSAVKARFSCGHWLVLQLVLHWRQMQKAVLVVFGAALLVLSLCLVKGRPPQLH